MSEQLVEETENEEGWRRILRSAHVHSIAAKNLATAAVGDSINGDAAFKTNTHAAERPPWLAGNRSPEVLLASNQHSGSHRGSSSYAHRDAINKEIHGS
jgi:hypothetical protein